MCCISCWPALHAHWGSSSSSCLAPPAAMHGRQSAQQSGGNALEPWRCHVSHVSMCACKTPARNELSCKDRHLPHPCRRAGSQSRGCPLQGLHATPTLEAHQRRFTSNGWTRASAVDLDTVYRLHIDPVDKRRSCRLAPCHCVCMLGLHAAPVRLQRFYDALWWILGEWDFASAGHSMQHACYRGRKHAQT